MSDESRRPGELDETPRFFQRPDWAAFGVTALVALAVYFFTMPPEVGLGDDGHIVSSTYLGVPITPGYRVWTVYSWLFTKLPFSNIAWRVDLSITVASALACGVIALMVSRVGVLVLENSPRHGTIPEREKKWLRIVCGAVAGLGFGFDGCFWTWDEMYYSQPLNLLLFALTLCLLTRWFFMPHQRRCLYAAAFIYGLTLADGHSLVLVAPGLALMVALADPKLGREIISGLVMIAILLLTQLGVGANHPLGNYVAEILAVIAFSLILLVIRTRRVLTEWKAVSVCAMLLLLGFAACLLLPIFSMMNPPMNWGYPRTVGGFKHVMSRAQFEQPNPTQNFARFVMQLGLYGKIAAREFGWHYLLAAMVLIGFLHKIPTRGRRWLLGILLVWLSAALLMIVGANMEPDRASVEIAGPLFAASHLVLAVLAGCGLMLVGVYLARPSRPAD